MSIPATLLSSAHKSVRTHQGPLHAKNTGPQLPVLRTVEKHYKLTVNFRAYRLAYRFTLYDHMVLRCIANSVKKVKSHMKVCFLDSKEPISGIGVVATFKLICASNKIHGGAVMYVLPVHKFWIIRMQLMAIF